MEKKCALCGDIIDDSYIYYGLNDEYICKDCYEKLSEKEKSKYGLIDDNLSFLEKELNIRFGSNVKAYTSEIARRAIEDMAKDRRKYAEKLFKMNTKEAEFKDNGAES